jgi:hypothetical protein
MKSRAKVWFGSAGRGGDDTIAGPDRNITTTSSIAARWCSLQPRTTYEVRDERSLVAATVERSHQALSRGQVRADIYTRYKHLNERAA